MNKIKEIIKRQYNRISDYYIERAIDDIGVKDNNTYSNLDACNNHNSIKPSDLKKFYKNCDDIFSYAKSLLIDDIVKEMFSFYDLDNKEIEEVKKEIINIFEEKNYDK